MKTDVIIKLKLKVLVMFLLMSVTVFAQTNTELLNNKAIIEMHKAGLSTGTMVAKIETSYCNFDVTTTGLIALKKQGVSNEVINAMVNKKSGQTASSINPSLSSPAIVKKVNIELLNYVHTFYNDTIVPLEKVLANVKTKMKALGYGGTNFVLEIEGETSPIKLNPLNTYSFVIKTGGETPPDIVLYKLKKSGKKREAVTSKFTMGGMKGSEGAATVNFSKIEDGVFKILLSEPLQKGEYFFLNRAIANAGTNSEVFAFSVN